MSEETDQPTDVGFSEGATMGKYHPLLGDIDYRDHQFKSWQEKVNWEVQAIQKAITNLMRALKKWEKTQR